MRKLFLLFILCYSGIFFSQITYFNYLDYTVKRTAEGFGSTGIGTYTVTESFYINGDTLINGKYYYKQQKIAASNLPWPVAAGPSYIREDATLKQYLYNPQTNTETVQYDWNQYLQLNVGSVFPNASVASCTVTAIDSVLLGTRYLKRWHGIYSSGPSTNVATPAPSFIVEGIGEISDNICTQAIHSSYRVNCYLKQNNLLNFNLNSTCSNIHPNTVYENIINKQDLFIFPNPATDKLNILVENVTGLKQVLIYNSTGQIIKEEEVLFKNNTTTVNTSDVPTGIYTLQISDLPNTSKTKIINKRFVILK